MRLLGRGGMGEVYEAEDTRKHRVVALKLISEQFSGNSVFRARMQREADAAGRLTEPHVVPIHDYGEIDGLLYLEMRLIDGTDLSTLLKRSGPLNPPRAVAIVRQIAAALDAAHTSGVTHRDVKPENILITGDDFAYLVDFGIARAAADPGLTQTGTAMGTYNYMAPERFSSDEVTYRADIYSLACVLAECLTGSPPYRGETIERLIAAHLTQPSPRPSELRPGRVPAALDEVIARGMAKNPDDRYRSAGDLATAAHDALTEPEQHQSTRILRQGDRSTTPGGIADSGPETLRAPSPAWEGGPQTMARPVPSGATQPVPTAPPTGQQAGWRRQPGPPPPASGPPDFRPPPSARGRSDDQRKRRIIIGAAALVVIAVVVAVGYLVTGPSGPSTPASGQTVLTFGGIDYRLSPGAVAVDGDGNVYVASQGMYGRVLKLPVGSTKPTELPFNGLYQPQGLAIDGAGTVYVTDFNNRVVKLTAGSNDQTDLPFNGLNYPEGVAVDTSGAVYVADRGNDRVVKLAAGSSAPTDLPFDGLNNPDGVAVDQGGNVYVTDTDNNRVLELAAGSNTQTVLPFTGISVPWGIAVDSKSNVYVTEHDKNKVAKLVAGANNSTELPFTGLNTPLDVTVDKDGNVYVADRGNDRVVKLVAG
ncbi:serine/threonine-protein kinase PknD [Mycobacterium sp.]|uniref:serine/threonine-protein kinase PknD n=1 Tax=Mycobacterium sp. TaxID=1785 RepID=UPI003D6C162F